MYLSHFRILAALFIFTHIYPLVEYFLEKRLELLENRQISKKFLDGKKVTIFIYFILLQSRKLNQRTLKDVRYGAQGQYYPLLLLKKFAPKLFSKNIEMARVIKE